MKNLPKRRPLRRWWQFELRLAFRALTATAVPLALAHYIGLVPALVLLCGATTIVLARANRRESLRHRNRALSLWATAWAALITWAQLRAAADAKDVRELLSWLAIWVFSLCIFGITSLDGVRAVVVVRNAGSEQLAAVIATENYWNGETVTRKVGAIAPGAKRRIAPRYFDVTLRVSYSVAGKTHEVEQAFELERGDEVVLKLGQLNSPVVPPPFMMN